MTTSFLVFNLGPGDLEVGIHQMNDAGYVTGPPTCHTIKPTCGSQFMCYKNQKVEVRERPEVSPSAEGEPSL